jgi:hypothetical protein
LKKYYCNQCSQEFTRRWNMGRHIDYMHSSYNRKPPIPQHKAQDFSHDVNSYLPEARSNKDNALQSSGGYSTGLSLSEQYVWTAFVANELSKINDTLKAILNALLTISMNKPT